MNRREKMTEESNNVGVFKAPSYIHFMGYEKTASSLIPHASIELMKMSRDGIWVNPDIPVEETARQVLEILDNALKNMVRIAVEEEREACAKVCESAGPDAGPIYCAFAIRRRGAP
jgi:hypothetical protein